MCPVNKQHTVSHNIQVFGVFFSDEKWKVDCPMPSGLWPSAGTLFSDHLHRLPLQADRCRPWTSRLCGTLENSSCAGIHVLLPPTRVHELRWIELCSWFHLRWQLILPESTLLLLCCVRCKSWTANTTSHLFIHIVSSTFPKANTCTCCLMLPVGHMSYALFEDAIIFGIRNAHGFGYA